MHAQVVPPRRKRLTIGQLFAAVFTCILFAFIGPPIIVVGGLVLWGFVCYVVTGSSTGRVWGL